MVIYPAAGGDGVTCRIITDRAISKYQRGAAGEHTAAVADRCIPIYGTIRKGYGCCLIAKYPAALSIGLIVTDSAIDKTRRRPEAAHTSTVPVSGIISDSAIVEYRRTSAVRASAGRIRPRARGATILDAAECQ